MGAVITAEQMRSICAPSAVEVFRRAAGVQLSEAPEGPSGAVYTVYTAFEQGLNAGLALTAELPFLKRATGFMLQMEHAGPQLIQDSTVEFFNILCGHIAVALFRDHRVAARFQIPVFTEGPFRSDEADWKLRFRGDGDERILLSYYTAPDWAKKNPGGKC